MELINPKKNIYLFIYFSESEHGIFKAILEGPIDLSSDPWPNISDGAKDLVKKMLCKDPSKRLTAFQVLSKFRSLRYRFSSLFCFDCVCLYAINYTYHLLADHPWIKEDGEAPDVPLDNAVLNKLKQFRAMNKFKKAALRVKMFSLPCCSQPLYKYSTDSNNSSKRDSRRLLELYRW